MVAQLHSGTVGGGLYWNVGSGSLLQKTGPNYLAVD